MVGFFPTPYPDECLYSILCRYYARGGYGSYESCVKELFGGLQTLTLSVFLPMKIETVDSWYSHLSGVTRHDLAINHTLYSYWAIVYPESFRTDMDTAINGGVPVIETNNLGSLRSRRSWAKCLKYCPLCAAEDNTVYGETYWRRQHQLSEMFYCTKHKVRLVSSLVQMKQTSTGFYPASQEIYAEYADGFHDNLAQYKDKFLRIACECEWLITHGLDIDWAVNGHDKYWKLLRDKGLASFQGRCDYTALESAFRDYWGKDFVNTLLEETSDTRFKGWTHQVDKNKMRSYIPLYHILLMCFLAGSVSDFVKSNPANTPYGHPPFVCENPVCPHYRVDGANMVSLKYYCAGATAVFECSYCGLKYKHNKAKYSRELRVVTDYGHLWDSELRRCSQDPMITNEQTAEILKCTMSVLMLQKKKRGLLERPFFDKEIGAEKYYKMQVDKLCQEYEEVTIAILQEKVPGAYSYLGDHDYDWLRSRIVFGNEQKHIREYEIQLLASVRDIVAQLNNDGYPKRQVTFGYIAGLIGSTRDKLRCRASTRLLLSGVVESQSDWLLRRTTEVCNERAALSKPTTVKTIKRELCLHESTFTQYEKLMKEVICTIYG